MSAVRNELVEEIWDMLDSLNEVDLRNALRRVSASDLITLSTAIRKAINDAVPPAYETCCCSACERNRAAEIKSDARSQQ